MRNNIKIVSQTTYFNGINPPYSSNKFLEPFEIIIIYYKIYKPFGQPT